MLLMQWPLLLILLLLLSDGASSIHPLKGFLLVIFQFVKELMQNFNFGPEKSVEFEEEKEENKKDEGKGSPLRQIEFHV